MPAQRRAQRSASALVALCGFGLALAALWSAFFRAHTTWLTEFVIGGTLCMAAVNAACQRESILTHARRDWHYIGRAYALYLLAGAIVEAVGNAALGWWDYTPLDRNAYVVHLILIQYPLGFAYLYEFYVWLRGLVRSASLALLVGGLLNAFLVEIPNTFAPEWTYHIPYVSVELLRVNIVVMSGWVILIAIPLIAQRILRQHRSPLRAAPAERSSRATSVAPAPRPAAQAPAKTRTPPTRPGTKCAP